MALTIGALAREADVNAQTVRYYERRGLLPPPPRSRSGYRQFPTDSVARIRFIKRAQHLGFALGEILDLLTLRVHPRSNCAEVRGRAVSKREDIDRKMAALQDLGSALDELIEACDSNTPTHECPILESLEE